MRGRHAGCMHASAHPIRMGEGYGSQMLRAHVVRKMPLMKV